MTSRKPHGNLRQLENVLEHACVLGRCEVITTGDLPNDFIETTGASSSLGRADPSVEKRRIREALERTAFNTTEIARLLGISRRTLYRRLAEIDIEA